VGDGVGSSELASACSVSGCFGSPYLWVAGSWLSENSEFATDSSLEEGVWSEPVSPLFAGLGTNFPTYKRLTAGTQTIFFGSRGACGTRHFPSISASFARVANRLKC
jgi:hypothetical protein